MRGGLAHAASKAPRRTHPERGRTNPIVLDELAQEDDDISCAAARTRPPESGWRSPKSADWPPAGTSATAAMSSSHRQRAGHRGIAFAFAAVVHLGQPRPHVATRCTQVRRLGDQVAGRPPQSASRRSSPARPHRPSETSSAATNLATTSWRRGQRDFSVFAEW